MKMKDIYYVPSLKKNLLSISSLDEKGFKFDFIDGEVIMWARGKYIHDSMVIGFEEGGLYNLNGHSYSTLVHIIVNPSELWNRIFDHINYKALSIIIKMAKHFLEIQVKNVGICKGCAQGKNVKNPFPRNNNKSKGALDILHSDLCGPISPTSLSEYVYYVSFIDDISCNI
jgi:hypothetical protein